MIHVMVRPPDGSPLQWSHPCPEVLTFRTWDRAARWVKGDGQIAGLAVIMVEFTGKHAKEAARLGQRAQING